MNRNEDITNEQQPSNRPTLPGWLFRLMMFREKTKVKGKTKAKHLEVSGKLRTFAFDGSNDRAPAFGLTRTTIFMRGCYARCGEYDESVYYILITNNFHEKTAIR